MTYLELASDYCCVMMALAPDYGRRIRLRRQALGMSQAQLGERVGASESAVLSWEKHRHEPTRKQGAIEAVLGISLSGPEPVPDPQEMALRAALEQLRENPLMKLDEAGVERLVRAYRGEPGAAHRDGAAERAG